MEEGMVLLLLLLIDCLHPKTKEVVDLLHLFDLNCLHLKVAMNDDHLGVVLKHQVTVYKKP